MSETQAPQRQNRMDRELDARAVTFERPKAWAPPEVLPSPNDRPGWTHRWVRLAVLGKPDPSNVSSKLREGYEPCKAQEYPELMMHAVSEGQFKGGIQNGDLLLCRIPSEFLSQRAAYYDKQNQAQMESVDNNFLRESNPKMPLFAERKSSVSFGSGSKT
ncbi:hypothetical protein EBT31_15575 [bacterium]|nr:hypothetical protein [bacterium]